MNKSKLQKTISYVEGEVKKPSKLQKAKKPKFYVAKAASSKFILLEGWWCHVVIESHKYGVLGKGCHYSC